MVHSDEGKTVSWIISKAIMTDYESSRYLQEQEGGYSEENCLDGEQSVQSNGTPTQLVYLSQDKMTAFSRLSRFGMMCKPLTESLGEDLLTWYLEDSRAKTLAVQAKEQESMANDQECGRTWPGLLAKYDPDTHTLKTAQCLLFEDSTESCVTLPRWGMMRNGDVYLRETAGLCMIGTESGLWATPTARDYKGITITKNNPHGFNRNLCNDVFKYPTPTCQDSDKATTRWRDNRQNNLTAYVNKYPTPVVSMHNGWSPGHNRANTNDRLDYKIERESFENGERMRLKPDWVEWLMLWPIKWTDIGYTDNDNFLFWFENHEKIIEGYESEFFDDEPDERVSKNEKARKERLTAIGNGQVPICSAMAFRILAERFGD